MKLEKRAVHVELEDFLLDRCPYEACGNNSGGACEEIDPEFLQEKLELVRDFLKEAQEEVTKGAKKLDEVLLQYDFDCYTDIPEDICPFCASAYVEVVGSRGEYWGVPANEMIWECPQKCDY